MKKPKEVMSKTELRRLAFANSERLKKPVAVDGRRMQWVGIGFVDEGPVQGDEEIEAVED